MNYQAVLNRPNVAKPVLFQDVIARNNKQQAIPNLLPEVLLLTSYPPRECGIATYSQDLLKALNNKFGDSFALKVCALECDQTQRTYPAEVDYVLNTSETSNYVDLMHNIKCNKDLKLVLIQHEFGLYEQNGATDFLQFIYSINKPIVIVFHTVLPRPDAVLKTKVRRIAAACASIVVMTKDSSAILMSDYGVSETKISVIPHGTHLVQHVDKALLKEKYSLIGKKVISTFGLLSSGKSIETTLNALPEIININPDVVFLVIGKTHSGVVRSEGEQYRVMLEDKVKTLKLHNHVRFVNQYLLLEELLDYLQLTDIYLFTSKDPNQAVSGTFSYAMSCGCPIISTPIPHAKEVLKDNTGIIIDFENPAQLATAVNRLMCNESLRKEFSLNTLQEIVPTVWENSAINHALLLQKVIKQAEGVENFDKHTPSVLNQKQMILQYKIPEINLAHVQKMTTDFGMIQFSTINQPDIESGYTLDDNARALIALCMHHDKTGNKMDVPYLRKYLNFIKYCQQPEGNFLNYVDKTHGFTDQNYETNLLDSNGRAIWALGYLLSKQHQLPRDMVETAEDVLQRALLCVDAIHATRAMAFVIKGLYYYNLEKKPRVNTRLITLLANRLVQMYRHESEPTWQWYESYLTYGNSILPEALLYAYLATDDTVYKDIAKTTFDFLLSLTFNEQGIKVISNRGWLHKGKAAEEHGEQPIDVAYTILALRAFYAVFKDNNYKTKMDTAFNWFLGNNHLHQIIYNPCTGGCYDGLEHNYVNLNQGAESTLSYLMARLTIEKKGL